MTLILCCGDRNWKDRNTVESIIKSLPINTTIMHGNARGLDILSGKIAKEYGLEIIKIDAKWLKYGKSAGPIRNREMLDKHPDIVLAFHNNITESLGTKNCVLEACKRNIPTYIITSDHDKTINNTLRAQIRKSTRRKIKINKG